MRPLPKALPHPEPYEPTELRLLAVAMRNAEPIRVVVPLPDEGSGMWVAVRWGAALGAVLYVVFRLQGWL